MLLNELNVDNTEVNKKNKRKLLEKIKSSKKKVNKTEIEETKEADSQDDETSNEDDISQDDESEPDENNVNTYSQEVLCKDNLENEETLKNGYYLIKHFCLGHLLKIKIMY